MRQAITVTRHKNLWSSSSFSEAQRRRTVFKSAENTNKSHAKICYILYWTAQSGFFIIINTLRIYNSCSPPSLDQESIAKAILSCTTYCNTTSWQEAKRPLTPALFSQQHCYIFTDFKCQRSLPTKLRASRASRAWPAVKNHWGLGYSEGKHLSRGHIRMLLDKLLAQDGKKVEREEKHISQPSNV